MKQAIGSLVPSTVHGKQSEFGEKIRASFLPMNRESVLNCEFRGAGRGEGRDLFPEFDDFFSERFYSCVWSIDISALNLPARGENGCPMLA